MSMSPIAVAMIVFACVFGGALLGILLHSLLPEHHLGSDSKDIVKLGMGLVATMSALVLGLLVASAKGFYDAQSTELTQMSANIALLDRVLTHYGPEADEPRAQLRAVVLRLLDLLWPQAGPSAAPSAPPAAGEALYEEIQALSPKSDEQRAIQGLASGLAVA